MEELSGIYIHIPFCHHKCLYCDFYSLTRLEAIEPFLNNLHKEIKANSESWSDFSFDTIYLGGGTPSLLTPHQIAAIITDLKGNFRFTNDIEITLEANPGTIESDKAKGYADSGVNRVSLGVQSFSESELGFLERIHSGEDIYNSMDTLRKTGFNNISIDLISALPGQTMPGLKENLKKAVLLEPEHISIYTLIFEEKTPLGKLMKEGKVLPVSDELESQMYLETIAVLEKYGYHWYEVSNFAKEKQHQSRHNNKYWQLKPYLGLGPSAHSYNIQQRWSNPRSLTQYNKALNSGESPSSAPESLDLETQMTEFAFLGLRLREGIEKKRFKRKFNQAFEDVFPDFIRRFDGTQWLVNDADKVALTTDGLPICDELAAYLNAEPLCASF